MAIPRDLREKCLRQFDALVEMGKGLLAGMKYPAGNRSNVILITSTASGPQAMVDALGMTQWCTQCVNLLQHVISTTGPNRGILAEFKTSTQSNTGGRPEFLLARLIALRDDFQKGFLDDPWDQLRVAVESDLIKQAEELFCGSYFMAAAVLGRAAIEVELRARCTTHSITITKQNGDFRKLNDLNTELRNVQEYGTSTQQEITGWAGVGNDAAHAKPVDPKAVERMLAGVASFIERD